MLATLRHAVPMTTRGISLALDATTMACTAVADTTRGRSLPGLATVTRGLEGTSMLVEVCNTLLVNTVLADDIAEAAASLYAVQALPPRSCFRLWSTIFAGLTRLATCEGGPSAGLYRAAMSENRRWAFAYASNDLHGALQSLEQLSASIQAMRLELGDDASFPCRVVAVYDTWVRFVRCLTLAAGEARLTSDRSLERVRAFLEESAGRGLSVYDMHTLCWIIDALRGRFDDAAIRAIVAAFAPHGLEYAALDRHVMLAHVALAELAV
jgi:hypothetical protein